MRNRIENENCSFYLWYANLKYIGIVILSEHLRLYCYQKSIKFNYRKSQSGARISLQEGTGRN